MITQERLKHLVNYDHSTGIFTRRVTYGRHDCFKAGVTLGCDNGSGYLTITLDKSKYYAHRLAWLYVTGGWPKAEIDHRDLNRANNKFDNLREATRNTNSFNKPVQKNNKIGIKGVSWSTTMKQFESRITVYGKQICLGYFETKEAAALVYESAAKKYHGEYARTA